MERRDFIKVVASITTASTFVPISVVADDSEIQSLTNWPDKCEDGILEYKGWLISINDKPSNSNRLADY